MVTSSSVLHNLAMSPLQSRTLASSLFLVFSKDVREISTVTLSFPSLLNALVAARNPFRLFARTNTSSRNSSSEYRSDSLRYFNFIMEYTKYIKEAYANPFPNARTRIRAGELSCTAVFCVFVWSVCQDLHTYIYIERGTVMIQNVENYRFRDD